MLKEDLPGEVSVAQGLDPPRDNRLKRQPVGGTKIEKSSHEPRLSCGPPLARRKDHRKHPIDQCCQPHPLVPWNNHVGQARTQQIARSRERGRCYMGRNEIAWSRPHSKKTVHFLTKDLSAMQKHKPVRCSVRTIKCSVISLPT